MVLCVGRISTCCLCCCGGVLSARPLVLTFMTAVEMRKSKSHIDIQVVVHLLCHHIFDSEWLCIQPIFSDKGV